MTQKNWLWVLGLLLGASLVQAQTAAQTPAGSSNAPATIKNGAVSTASAEKSEGFVAPRETVDNAQTKSDKKTEPALKVVFNPQKQKDPTLSPDDILLLKYREKQRLAALEAERQRRLAEERRRQEEEERRRQEELARIKDPAREVRNKIRVSGVIGQEVFIGDKIYTIGNTYLGARIVEVDQDYVIFSYKGHRFRKNVQL